MNRLAFLQTSLRSGPAEDEGAKMAARLARADMIRRFTAAGRPGFYLRVDRAGPISRRG